MKNQVLTIAFSLDRGYNTTMICYTAYYFDLRSRYHVLFPENTFGFNPK